MNQEPSPEQRHNPPAEVRNVQARFYTHELGEPPTFVQIDGITYRVEGDQEEVNTTLQLQDLRAKLVGHLDEEASHLVREMLDLMEQDGNHQLDVAEAKLIELLPNHEAAIKHVFCPDEYALSAADYIRHRYCTLGTPGPGLQEDADEEQP